MKAFFSLRGDGSSRRSRHELADDSAQGTGYDSRDDIFYPTSTSASTPPPPASTTTRGKKKFFKSNGTTATTNDRSHNKTSSSAGWTDVARNGTAPPLHGPASSSSASGPNAADIGSMPVAVSVRSKKSNGSFGSHHAGASTAGNTGSIGALLGGFNSVNSLGRTDETPGRNRTSIRSGSLASIFSGSVRPGSMTKTNSFGGSDKHHTTRAPNANGHNQPIDPRPPSAAGAGLHPGTDRLARRGSAASRTSSHASMQSDDHSSGRRSSGINAVRGFFKDRSAGSPVATTPTSHAPSSYYDPTSTRTKRRGITPTLESRTSGGWPGIKEAPDVHPEVFIVSNDSNASGKRRGSGQETGVNTNGIVPPSGNSPQPPEDVKQEEVTPRADQGQAQFQSPHAEDSSTGTRRHSAISTATIQPPHIPSVVEPSESAPAPTATTPPVQPPSPTQETDVVAPKASLRKRLSGTLRPRKSLNFFGNGEQVDAKGKRRSQAFSEGGIQGTASPQDDRLLPANENSPLSPSLVRRPGANSGGASVSIPRHRPATSSSSVSRASSILSGGTTNTSTNDRSARRRDSYIASSPPSAAYNRFKGGASKRGHHAAGKSLSSPQDLALQLNELAVSHADGLLSDEEYRMLRQGLFEEQLGQRSAVSAVAESGTPASGAAAFADSPTSYFAVLAGRDAMMSPTFRQSVVDADESARVGAAVVDEAHRMQEDQRSTAGGSTVSRSHLPSLFRRGSHRSQQSQASDAGRREEQDGRLSSLPPKSKSRSNTISTEDTTASSSSSSGAVHALDGAGGQSLHPVRLPHNGSRSTKSGSSSIISSSQHTASRPEPSVKSYHGGGASTSSVRLRLTSSSSAKSQKRAQDLETEVRRRRAQRANSLLSAESGHSGRAADDGSSIMTRNRATSLAAGEDDSVLQLQQATAAVSLTANASRLDTQDVVYADKSSEEIEAELRVIETEGRKLLFAFESLESALFKRVGGDDNTALVDQIERGLPAKMELTAAGSFNTRSKKSTRNRAVAGASGVADTSAKVDFPTASLQKVQSQLVDVRTRRADVVERYEDRMAFLRSKARGARIREQLA